MSELNGERIGEKGAKGRIKKKKIIFQINVRSIKRFLARFLKKKLSSNLFPFDRLFLFSLPHPPPLNRFYYQPRFSSFFSSSEKEGYALL